METADTVGVRCVLNGERWEGAVRPAQLLLDFLRDELGLTGTKRGCEWMSCGVCTVIVDGRPLSACGVLAADIDAADVRTIEGLSAQGRLSALQQAFIEKVGYQCGYCTPGQLMSATALIESQEQLTRDRIQTWMQGNLCRCGNYEGILAAIELALERIGRPIRAPAGHEEPGEKGELAYE